MARRVLLESSDEERFAAHVIREHHLGRPIERILEDPYLRNRLVEGARQRLVERPARIAARTLSLSPRSGHYPLRD